MVSKDLAEEISKNIRDLELFSKPVIGGLLIKLNYQAAPTITEIKN